MMKKELNINTVLDLANNSDVKSFAFFGDRIIYHGQVDQYISLPSEDDLTLIENSKSFFKFMNRECMQIRVHCFNLEVIQSKIIKGTKNSVSNYKEIKNIAYDLLFKAKQRGLEVDYIEVAHTHMGDQYAYMDESGQVRKILSKGLSDADINTIKMIKPFLGHRVIIKSISESKIAYCAQI